MLFRSGWRRPSGVVDVRVDLRDKAMPKGVKKMRDKEIGEKGVTRGYGDAGASPESTNSAGGRGGFASSKTSSPAAIGR